MTRKKVTCRSCHTSMNLLPDGGYSCFACGRVVTATEARKTLSPDSDITLMPARSVRGFEMPDPSTITAPMECYEKHEGSSHSLVFRSVHSTGHIDWYCNYCGNCYTASIKGTWA